MRARRLLATLAATTTLLCGGACVGPFAPESPAPTPIATAPATPTAELTPTPVPTPVRPPVAAQARITTEDLNVRAGPERTFPVIGRLQPGDEVGVMGRSADELWLALDGLGWSFYDENWYELDSPFDELPTVGVEATYAPTHPAGLDTGFPLINDLVADVAAGSADVLAAHVEPRTVPCGPGADDAPAGPACPAGTEAGTPTEAIALLACELEWAPAGQKREAIDRFLSDARGEHAPLALYAVIGAEPDDPAATYVVLFAFTTGEGRALWLGQSGAITLLAVGCDAEPAGTLLAKVAEQPTYYVGPFAPKPLTPAR